MRSTVAKNEMLANVCRHGKQRWEWKAWNLVSMLVQMMKELEIKGSDMIGGSLKLMMRLDGMVGLKSRLEINWDSVARART